MKSNKHYNCLGCPHCSAPLHDALFVFEFKSEIKTVKCESCDFLGYRKGWELLSKKEQNEYERTKTKSANTQTENINRNVYC